MEMFFFDALLLSDARRAPSSLVTRHDPAITGAGV